MQDCSKGIVPHQNHWVHRNRRRVSGSVLICVLATLILTGTAVAVTKPSGSQKPKPQTTQKAEKPATPKPPAVNGKSEQARPQVNDGDHGKGTSLPTGIGKSEQARPQANDGDGVHGKKNLTTGTTTTSGNTPKPMK